MLLGKIQWHSGMIPGSVFSNHSWQAWWNTWDIRDRTWVGYNQDKHTTGKTITPASTIFINYMKQGWAAFSSIQRPLQALCQGSLPAMPGSFGVLDTRLAAGKACCLNSWILSTIFCFIFRPHTVILRRYLFYTQKSLVAQGSNLGWSYARQSPNHCAPAQTHLVNYF